MIVGSGLISTALVDRWDFIQYAAGVSNSQCTDEEEFSRDKERLNSHLPRGGRFVYFSTCSEADSMYVRHKRECEELVRSRGNYLICRLPIVSGKTTNPHTLLNYVHSRVQRSEKFDVWPAHRRNVIDIIDVGTIVRWLLKDSADETVNIAAPFDYSMAEIVSAFEQLMSKKAIVKLHEGAGGNKLDVERIYHAPVHWGNDYLSSTLWKHYR
jgi:hypothetical protein